MYQSFGSWQGESELFKWWNPLITTIFHPICQCTTKFRLPVIFFLRIWNNPPCIKKFQKFCLRKSSWEKFPFSEKLLARADDVDSWKIARATGTFCLQLPGWSTLCVIFGAFLKLASSRLSFSKTSWNNFQEIWPPLNEIGSSKLSFQKLKIWSVCSSINYFLRF